MDIYLVRHGETGGNVAHRHQAEHTQLSKLGEEQAYKVGQVLKEYEPTHLVASNLVRTIETAGIIGEACGLIPDTDASLIELVRPDRMYGHRHHSFKSVWFYAQWYLGFSIGGESYRDLLERIKKAKALLAGYPKDARLVVVSHSVFISLFIAHLCADKKLTPLNALLTFKKVVTMPNTHVSHITYSEDVWEGKCKWRVK